MKPKLIFLFQDGWDEAAIGAAPRIEYPSRLSQDARACAYEVAERAMRAVGFDHGAFNVELLVDRAGGRMRVIEINPRLAAQLGDLY